MPPLALLQAAPSAPSVVSSTVFPVVLMFVLAYFLLIRPVQKQRREQADMRNALKPGDEVLTSAGIFGTVTKLREERVHVRVADGVQLEMTKTAIASVVPPKSKE